MSAKGRTLNGAESSDPPQDAIMNYLNRLARKRPGKKPLISLLEYTKICQAIQPLQVLLPFIDQDTVMEVMDEYSEDPKPTARQISLDEEKRWLKSSEDNEELISHFSFEEAHSHFTVAPEQRIRRVIFLKKEYERPVESPAIPYKLINGEKYFFLVLRMYRYQYEKDWLETAQKKKRS